VIGALDFGDLTSVDLLPSTFESALEFLFDLLSSSVDSFYLTRVILATKFG